MFKERSSGVGTPNFGELKQKCLTLTIDGYIKMKFLQQHHFRCFQFFFS
jgi:hypothetical protein